MKNEQNVVVRMKCKEFSIPAVKDGVVLGKEASIGCEAMRRALKLLQDTDFAHIEMADKDDVIGDIFVRKSILRRLPEAKLVDLVLRRVKPSMDSSEILHLELEVDLLLEESL